MTNTRIGAFGFALVWTCLLPVAALGCGDSAADDASDGGATSGEFLALSYNVAGLPEGLTSDPDPLTRMPLISKLLNGYDLVLTQEDWLTPSPNPLAPTRVYHELLTTSAKHAYQSIPLKSPVGKDAVHWPATADRAAQPAILSDGMNEFSNIPFDPKTTQHIAWNDCYGGITGPGASDCLATKGFTLSVHTLSSGATIDVYDVHGEAGRTDQDLRLMHAAFEQLATFINAPTRKGHAILLGGDTNLHTERPVSDQNPDADIWQTLLDATGLVDVCDTKTTGIHCAQSRNAEMIDKFAYRSSDNIELSVLSQQRETEKFTYPGGYLSDHDPITVRFAWKLQNR